MILNHSKTIRNVISLLCISIMVCRDINSSCRETWHEDPRAWSLTNLENVCVLYGHMGGVIVGLGYMSY